jgi:hypothetical protein
MELEAAISYLLALAVPAWLVGEYVVHTWKTSERSAVDRRPSREDFIGGIAAPSMRAKRPQA